MKCKRDNIFVLLKFDKVCIYIYIFFVLIKWKFVSDRKVIKKWFKILVYVFLLVKL